jgi:tetratricopeptide (TPR) repeat protein
MYLPLLAVVGLAVIIPLWAARVALRHRRQQGGAPLWLGGVWLGAALMLALPLGWRTSNRLDDYRSRVAIWHADVRADPENPVALYNLAAALFDARRYAQAAPVIERAVVLMPTMDRGVVLLENTYGALGRPEAVIPLLQGLAASDPDLARLHWRYGRACLRAKAANQAIAPLRRAVELQPDLVNAWEDLGEAMAATGRLEEALRALDEAIERADASSRIRLLRRRRAFEAKLDKAKAPGAPIDQSDS